MSTQDFDVVIIGLGPSGGTLANLLAMNNLSILINKLLVGNSYTNNLQIGLKNY